MGPLGMGEIVVLFILALLIFGPKKLPELGKTFGKGMAEFKKASNELKSTFQREMDSISEEAKDVKTIARETQKDINTSYYDDNDDDYYSGYDYSSGSGASASPATGNSSGSVAEAAGSGDAASGTSTAAAVAQAESNPEPGEQSESDQPVAGVPEAEEAAAVKSS